MAAMMAKGDELLDSWVRHAQQHNASTPELVAQLLINLEDQQNKTSIAAVLAATAIQRLAAVEGK